MKTNAWMGAVLAAGAAGVLPAGAATWAEQLIAGYETIRSVRCEIRREADSDDGRAQGRGQWLSIVFFERPDRLHVRNTLPLKRLIVCDGKEFRSHVEGDRLGFARPVDHLSEDMLISLRQVPGTAMDHLLRLRSLPETRLPPADPYPARYGYTATNRFVVLSADACQRLARVEVFDSAAMTNRLANYEYSLFVEAHPGVWIPQLHKGEARLGDARVTTTVHIDRLQVDTPLDPTLWQHDRWLKGVAFTNEFGAMYP